MSKILGLYRRTKGAHKAVPNQADKCNEPIEWQDGMVVEIWGKAWWGADEQWNAGEVTHLYDDDRPDPHWYVTYFEGGTSNSLDEVQWRFSEQADKAALKHYKQRTKELKDLIAHKAEKDELAAIQVKVNDMLATDSKPTGSYSNAPK